MKRYAIFKPKKREAFCYIAARNATAALKCARRMFKLPRGTEAVEAV